MNEHTSPAPTGQAPISYFIALGVLLAAIRGETPLDDEALFDLINVEPNDGARKRMAIGLKTHRLISDEQASAAIAFFKLKGA